MSLSRRTVASPVDLIIGGQAEPTFATEDQDRAGVTSQPPERPVRSSPQREKTPSATLAGGMDKVNFQLPKSLVERLRAVREGSKKPGYRAPTNAQILFEAIEENYTDLGEHFGPSSVGRLFAPQVPKRQHHDEPLVQVTFNLTTSNHAKLLELARESGAPTPTAYVGEALRRHLT